MERTDIDKIITFDTSERTMKHLSKMLKEIAKEIFGKKKSD